MTGDIWAGRGPSGDANYSLERNGRQAQARGVYVRQDHTSGQHVQVTVKGAVDGSSSGSIVSHGHGIHVFNEGVGDTWVDAEGDIRTVVGGIGISATVSQGGAKAWIAAKTVQTNSNRGIVLNHYGRNEGRVAVSGTVTSGGAEAIVVGATPQAGMESPEINATHLSVKVGSEEDRAGGAPGADKVESAKDGIVVTHMGGAMATADVRSYTYIKATNETDGTDATGIKITMGRNTGDEDIVQEDGTGTGTNGDGATTMTITGVTVRALAREEINAKTRGIDVNQQGIGAIRIVSSCSADTATADVDSCITTADEEGIRVQTATRTTGDVEITVGGEQDRGGNTGSNKAIKSGGEGINVIHAGSGMLTIVASGEIESGDVSVASSEIESGEAGIVVQNGTIDGMSGTTGNTTGTTGNIAITVGGETVGTNRAIRSQGDGIFLHQVGDGNATITVNGSIETTKGNGVQIDRDNGAGNATIVVNADITAGGASGANNGRSGVDVHFIHDASRVAMGDRTTTGDITLTVAEGVTITGDHAPAIDIGNFGTGNVTINVDGIIRRTGDAGIVMSLGNGSSGNLKLVLGDGAVVEDGRATSNRDIEVLGSATATIELTGAREDKTLDLGDISGFDDIDKKGSGTWTLTGEQDPGNTNHGNFALNQLTVDAGTLVLDLDSSDASQTPVLKFRNAGSTNPRITVAQGASLEINEDVSLEGRDEDTNEEIGVILELNDNLLLSGADGRIDVGGLEAGADASVTIEVEFPEVMEEMMEGMEGNGEEEGEEEGIVLDKARLDTGSGGATAPAGESIAVNIVPIGSVTPTTIGHLIRVGGTASMQGDTFVASNAIDSPFRFTLEHEQEDDGAANFWNLIAEQVASTAAGGSGAIHDTFVAVLSELSQLETLHGRLQDRKARYGTSSWVKTYAGNTEFTPSATSFDIEQAGFEMGLRAPLQNVFDQNWARGLSFDASIEFARAFTDVLVEMGMVDIHTDTFGLALGTTYNLGGLYIDGQLRYAQFENNIDNESMRLASPGANSLAAGIEIGHVLGGNVSLGDFMGGTDVPGDAGSPDVKLIPSVQLLWSSVDFDPYTSETGVPVRLDDGDVLFGRIGALAEGEWKKVHFLHESFPVADVRLRGHLNVLMPLEGELVTEIMGVPMASERMEPALDMGVGFAYEWDDAYALHAGFTTQQGEEVEGYTGSIGFKHEF